MPPASSIRARICAACALVAVATWAAPAPGDAAPAHAAAARAPERSRAIPKPDSTHLGRLRRLADLQAGLRFAEQESLATAWLPETRAKYGDPSLPVADLLADAGIARTMQGHIRDTRAREQLEAALRMRRAMLPPADGKITANLMNLAWNLRMSQKLDSARRVIEEVVALREQSLGPDHLDLATALRDLATVNLLQRHIDAAWAANERAIAIRTARLGPDHPDVAEVLATRGILCAQRGDYTAARNAYQASIRIREKALGPDARVLDGPLSNLGGLLTDLGDYPAARDTLERAARIELIHYGAHHPRRLQTLQNLARLQLRLGDDQSAIALCDTAFRGLRDLYGMDHAEARDAMQRLGLSHLQAGHLDEARRLLALALDGLAADSAQAPSEFRTTLQGLARAEWEDGHLTRAQALYERLDRFDRVVPDPEGGDVLTGKLLDRARYDELIHAWDAADSLYRQVAAVLDTTEEPTHPDWVITLLGRAHCAQHRGDEEASFRLALDAMNRAIACNQRLLRFLPEREALHYIDMRVSPLGSLLRSAARSGARREHVEAAWTALIRSRALVFDELAGRRHRRAEVEREHGTGAYDAVLAARGRLTRLELAGDDPDEVARARAEADSVEGAVARALPPAPGAAADSGAGLEAIRSALGPDEALVSFAWTRDGIEPERYYALTLSGGSGIERCIDLGDPATLERAIEAWATAAATPVARGAPEPASLRALSRTLYRRLWVPLRQPIAGALVVRVVADGAIHRVALEALEDEHGHPLLLGAARIAPLSAERDLAHRADATSARGALLVGGLDYAHAAPSPSPAGGPVASDALRERGCDPLASLRFPPLASSGAEVRDVAQVLRSALTSEVETWTGTDASEARLRRGAMGRSILHFATHGYRAADDCDPAPPGTRGVGGWTTLAGAPGPRGTATAAASSYRPSSSDAIEKAWALSGLALSGADEHGREPSGEDGLLTSAEISALDLAGTESVVLSACHTAAGLALEGEGLIGLQRAFAIAGARRVVSSRWAVGDETARLWMDDFYRARYADRRVASDAVWTAERAAYERARRKSPHPHPFGWAAFTGVGPDR